MIHDMRLSALQRYRQTAFLKCVAEPRQLPRDSGLEIAFAGRSNSGKSSALNALTGRQALARVSKTPGRTRMINFFRVAEDRYLVDLPGYGYARVSAAVQQAWQRSLESYLINRHALAGVVLLMDVRHPASALDRQFLDWSARRDLPCHILLTKCDKLANARRLEALRRVQRELAPQGTARSAQLFSATRKVGLEALVDVLDRWFDWLPED